MESIQAMTSNEDTQIQPSQEKMSTRPFKCDVCNSHFTQKKNLLRHQRTIHGNDRITCEQCKHTFSRVDNYKSHNCRPGGKRSSETEVGQPQVKRRCLHPLNPASAENETPAQWAKCNWCGHFRCLLPGKRYCQRCSFNGRGCKQCGRPLQERFYSQQTDVCDPCLRRRQRYEERRDQIGGGKISALQGSITTTTLTPSVEDNIDLLQFLANQQQNVQTILYDFLTEKKGMKWFLTIKMKFIKYDDNNESIHAEPVIRTINFWTNNSSEIDDQIAESYQRLYTASEEFQAVGSGWSLEKIVHLEVNVAEYVPLSASSYFPLPKYLADKKAILNIQNDDNKCFIWSILAHMHPVRLNAQRVSNYLPHESELDLTGIDFPIPLSQISKFQRLNKISINVFGYDELDGVFPLHVSDTDAPDRVDLMLLSQNDKRHFCLIRNFSRLMGDRTKHHEAAYYCRRCMHGFIRQDILDEHSPYCSPHGLQKVRLPDTEDETIIRFKRIQNQLRVPFVIYADFESITEKVSGCNPKPDSSYTSCYQKHKPSGYCYKVISSDPSYYQPATVYRGPDVISHFIDNLIREEGIINNKLRVVEPMQLSVEENYEFNAAKNCHICGKLLGSDRVRDHDHLTGMYRGAAHQYCNLQFQFRKQKRGSFNSTQESGLGDFFIPVIFHNLRGYDSHLLMKELDNTVKRKLTCLANNMEKYISFSVGNLRFIDSCQFLSASLDNLVENLKSENTSKFKQLKNEYPDEDKVELLLRKGVYPYDFMDHETKFDLGHLPAQSEFYNSLNDTNISDVDYDHASQVWSTFDLHTMGEYHDLYMKTDVLLLADVFEHFRNTSLDFYQLDPAHYYTLPGLGWDSMLKMGHVELELLTDLDMYLMFEQGLRGGIAMISQKYAKANNPYVKDFKEHEPCTYLMYYDANNLYGHSMSQPLPERDFSWVHPEDLENFDIMSISKDSEVGYVLEVDLVYPRTLHDKHSDYPLAPDSMVVKETMLSTHSKDLKEKLCIQGKPVKKLVPNLFDKTKYVLHYRNLQFYLDQGMRLSKIHRAIRFKQSAWLKPFIDFNTEKRKQATNEADKALFKLFNNSCFGRSMMNVRSHVNVELVNTPKRFKKLCAKPTFEAFKIFNQDLAAVHLKKATLFLNQPIYAGFTILDLSKLVMYDFHYNHMKAKHADKVALLFTDTDSLCYEIETQDVYTDMLRALHRFDTSNYDKKHCLFSKENEKVLGKMKDELGGCVMEEFVGLRPKMYSVLYDGKEKKTAKGVSKTVIEKQLRHSLYKQCLSAHVQLRHDMKQIRSYDHQLFTINQRKVSLSPFDDKRYVLEDGIHTLAHGHYKVVENSK